MLQSNGGRWAHLIITPNFPAMTADDHLHWTRFAPGTYADSPNLVNPSTIMGYDWTELQLVKRGSGSGGVNDGSSALFFIDNFTITNANGDVVFVIDFENGINPFTISGGGGQMAIVPASDAAFEDMTPPEFDLTLPSLAEHFADYFLFGNIWSTASFMNQPNTRDFFARQFSAVTAENHHKPDAISPSPDVMNLDTAEQIVAWAQDNDLAMVGHTLVWHSQSPLWMTGRGNTLVTRAQALENMEWFVSNYAGHFAGDMFSWDVLNEVFTDSVSQAAWDANPNWRAHLRREGVGLNNPNYLVWYDAFANGATGDECGSDFVFYAFYFARLADPYAILYYNDFNEEQPGKSRAIAQMVVEINERWANHPSYDGRLLIEVIGMQSHHHLDQWVTNLDNIRPAMMRFIETGARISITELDITIGTQANPLPTPLLAADQARLAAAYSRVMGYYLEFADYINRVSIWGISDAASWRSWGQPLLFDGRLQPKDAFWALFEATANVDGEEDVVVLPPVNIRIETDENNAFDGVLRWDAVEGATGYRVYINRVTPVATELAVVATEEVTDFYLIIPIEEPYLDLGALDLSPGVYTAQVRALGEEEGIYSELSAPFEFVVHGNDNGVTLPPAPAPRPPGGGTTGSPGWGTGNNRPNVTPDADDIEGADENDESADSDVEGDENEDADSDGTRGAGLPQTGSLAVLPQTGMAATTILGLAGAVSVTGGLVMAKKRK